MTDDPPRATILVGRVGRQAVLVDVCGNRILLSAAGARHAASLLLESADMLDTLGGGSKEVVEATHVAEGDEVRQITERVGLHSPRGS